MEGFSIQRVSVHGCVSKSKVPVKDPAGYNEMKQASQNCKENKYVHNDVREVNLPWLNLQRCESSLHGSEHDCHC